MKKFTSSLTLILLLPAFLWAAKLTVTTNAIVGSVTIGATSNLTLSNPTKVGQELTVNGNFSNGGTFLATGTTVTLGGTNQTYTIEVEDFLANMPINGDSTVACAADAVQPTPPTVEDNCGNTITPTGPTTGGTYGQNKIQTGCEGTITYTWNYADCEGNNHDWVYTYTIEVEDFLANMPVNGDSTVACAADAVQPTPPTVEDYCGNTITPTGPQTGGTYASGKLAAGCQGTITYTWNYADCVGNNHDWTFTYNVQDTIAPVVIVKNVVVYLDNQGYASITADDIDDGTSENCNSGFDKWINTYSFDCDDLGDVDVKLFAKDCAGNIGEATAVVTVMDTIKPMITNMPANIQINTDPLTCTAIVTWIEPLSNDNCTVISLISNYSSGEAFPLGLTTVTYTAEDQSGNIQTSSFTITVTDRETTPVAGNLIRVPDSDIVCDASSLYANLTPGIGGNGVDQSQFRVNIDGWTEWETYIPGTQFNITVPTMIEVRTRRLATCFESSPWYTMRWSAEPLAVAGNITKLPNVEKVCEGSNVSALVSSGSGGNGFDITEYRTNSGNWLSYTSGESISTAGKSSVEIGTRRLSQFCDPSAYNTVYWLVEPTPIAGTLTQLPSQGLLCETSSVSAELTAGSGGNGIDELEFRTTAATGQSNWIAYQSGAEIQLFGLTAVEIRTRRLAEICNPSQYATVSWQAEAIPQTGTLLPGPDLTVVCEGTPVSATLIAGIGGNGTDTLYFRTKTTQWSDYFKYESGQVIQTLGITAVEIVTQRLASVCQLPDAVSHTWSIENTLGVSAGPDATICANSTFTLSGSDVTEAATYMWTTSGDGYFSDPTILHPVYYPGTSDPNSNGVILTLTANSGIYCQYTDDMLLTFDPMVHASVEIIPNHNSVCAGSSVDYVAISTNPGTMPFYYWKVNGQHQGTNNARFIYAPQAGDQVWVEMMSSAACVIEAPAISNTVTVNVTTPVLTVSASPANAGTVTGAGNYPIGTQVIISAASNNGWEFLNWTTTAGLPVSNEATFTYTVTSCETQLRANFLSVSSIAGQVKFFNSDETAVVSPYIGGAFYVQLYSNGEPVSPAQMVTYDMLNGLQGYFAFHALVPGNDYTIRIWEGANSNALTNTWTWNHWGGATALDAFVVNFMSVNSNFVETFPWIGAAPYTPFFRSVADVNSSTTLTGLDALLINYRIVGFPGTSPFPGGGHNFKFGGKHMLQHTDKSYPNAPDVPFTMSGKYNSANFADQVYHEAIIPAVVQGNNIFNIYLNPAGDLNASFSPYQNKAAPLLDYQGVIAAEQGETITIPFQISDDIDLGAVTVGLSYDGALIKPLAVEGVEIAYINEDEHTIRLAWSGSESVNYHAGDGLFLLKAVVLDKMNGNEKFIELLPETEFANEKAEVVENIRLITRSINTTLTGLDIEKLQLIHNCQPNPFVHSAFIQYTLPIEGKVTLEIYNQFGQIVRTLVDEHQTSGLHRKQVFNADLDGAGLYIYRLRLESVSGIFDVKGNIIMTK